MTREARRWRKARDSLEKGRQRRRASVRKKMKNRRKEEEKYVLLPLWEGRACGARLQPDRPMIKRSASS